MRRTAHVKIKQTPAGFTCPYTSEVLVLTDLIVSFWSDLVSWCITNHCMVITFVDVLNRYLQALTEVQASTLMWHLYFLERYGCRALSTCYRQFDHVPPLASPPVSGASLRYFDIVSLSSHEVYSAKGFGKSFVHLPSFWQVEL